MIIFQLGAAQKRGATCVVILYQLTCRTVLNDALAQINTLAMIDVAFSQLFWGIVRHLYHCVKRAEALDASRDYRREFSKLSSHSWQST